MTSYAVMAIPSRDDYVWNLSSEKVPHLTLLFLGDKLRNVEHVIPFIRHAVGVSMCMFSLTVERRGMLGDKAADVLYFANDGIKKLEDFRSHLLTDPDIFEAYNSTEQFPTWTPHLTMGYPDTPAHPDKREYPGVPAVLFDRIALWTGDYEGVEFPLTGPASDEMSMRERGKNFLEHYGVKGMKWGVTRNRDTARVISDLSKTGVKSVKDAKDYVKKSSDAKRTEALRAKTRVAGVHTLSNKELRDVVARMRLETQFKDLKQEEFAQSYVGRGSRWAGNFVSDVLKDVTSSWLKRPGSNASGRTSRRVRVWTTGNELGNVIDGGRAIER